MLDRKHIRAPRSFDPGKGLPRERLAYLSEAEMDMVRRLTDGTVSRGPKGIPSFSVTSGTTSGNTMGGGERTSSNPSGGGPGGPFGANSGPSKSSTASGVTGGGGKGTSQNSSPKSPSGPSGPNSGASTGKPAGGPSASGVSTPSGGSRTPSSVSAGPAQTPSSPMGGQGTSFGSQAAARGFNAGVTARAQQTPASPMGGQNPSFGNPAAAAQANRSVASATKGGLNPSGSSKTASAMAMANTGRYPGQGVTARAPNGDMMAPNVGTDFNHTLRREAVDIGVENPYVDNSLGDFNKWATESFGRYAGLDPEVDKAYKKAREMTRTVVGEAATEGLLGQAAVAKVMENRLKYGDKYGRADFGDGEVLGKYGMLGGFDANGYQRARTGPSNEGYRQANEGTASYARASAAMADSLDPYGDLATQRPDVLNATHYLTRGLERSPDAPSWAGNDAWQSTRSQLGNHVFGNPERTVGQVEALRQSSMPAAAARTQAYNAANPPSQQGALHLASYDGGIPANAEASYRAPQVQTGNAVFGALAAMPGAISGLGRGFKTFNDTLSTPNAQFKQAAGLIGSSNPFVSGAAKIAAGQVIGPKVQEAARAAIQGLKDTFDPNNPRAQAAEAERRTNEYGPSAGDVRDDQTREQRGQRESSKSASATKSGGRNAEQGKGGDRETAPGKQPPKAAAKKAVGKKKIEDLATPDPTAPNPWDYFTNVTTKEQALRKLLGEEWYA